MSSILYRNNRQNYVTELGEFSFLTSPYLMCSLKQSEKCFVDLEVIGSVEHSPGGVHLPLFPSLGRGLPSVERCSTSVEFEP